MTLENGSLEIIFQSQNRQVVMGRDNENGQLGNDRGEAVSSMT